MNNSEQSFPNDIIEHHGKRYIALSDVERIIHRQERYHVTQLGNLENLGKKIKILDAFMLFCMGFISSQVTTIILDYLLGK